ncbi:TLD protein [Cryptosporidium felis]|nr:TLD protein [Cryptosporidium felis]
MGNAKSTEESRPSRDDNFKHKGGNNIWCDMDTLEIKRLGDLIGFENLSIENLEKNAEMDLVFISNCFPTALSKFYLGFFSFHCDGNTGKIKILNFIECVNSLLYSNNEIINKMIDYIMLNIVDENDILRILLSLAHFEMNFLLCGVDSTYKVDFENEKEYLDLIIKCSDFEFTVYKYYLFKSDVNYQRLSTRNSISEFINDNLPLFTILLRLSLRIHFNMVSHPNSIRTTFNGENNKTVQNGAGTPTNCIGITRRDSSVDSKEKCYFSDFFRSEYWMDANSRILSIEHCSVLRFQIFGDQRSGEYLNSFQPWNILYASWKHGLSLQRLVASIEGYGSHVLLLIRTIDDCVFGSICTGDWKEGNGKFCGDETCFLISLKPFFSVIGQTGKGRSFMYINTKYEFSPKGIGFGGEPEYSRLWLDSSLRTGACMKTDLTYETGMLYLPINKNSKRSSCLLLGTPFSAEKDESTTEMKKFSIADVEVWGLGGTQILKEYLDKKATSDYFKHERKVIDKSKFIKNEFDREYLLGNRYSQNNKQMFN